MELYDDEGDDLSGEGSDVKLKADVVALTSGKKEKYNINKSLNA